MGYLGSYVPVGVLTSNDSDNIAPVGCYRDGDGTDGNDGDIFMYVQNKSGGDITVGMVLVNYSTNNYQTTTTTTTDVKSIMGVAVGTLTNNYFGWIQVKGYRSDVMVNGAVSAGNGLGTMGTAGRVAASTTAGANHKIIAVGTNTSGNAAIGCMINCL